MSQMNRYSNNKARAKNVTFTGPIKCVAILLRLRLVVTLANHESPTTTLH